MTDETADAHKMPLLDHLIELRSRLLKSVESLAEKAREDLGDKLTDRQGSNRRPPGKLEAGAGEG